MCTLSSYLLQHLYEVRALHLHFVNMRGNIKHYIDWYHTKFSNCIIENFIFICPRQKSILISSFERMCFAP